MKIFLRFLHIILVSTFFLLDTTAFAQSIRYVKAVASGSRDGSSWANASNDLQSMINKGAGTVLVAKGTYRPQRLPSVLGVGNTPKNRDNAFAPRADVKIYGGFAGTEVVTDDETNLEELLSQRATLNKTPVSSAGT